MRWSATEPQRIGHALVLIVVRMVLLFFVGMGLLGRLVTDGDIFGAGWKSVLLVLGMLFPLDAGLVLWVLLMRVGRCSLAELGWRFDDVGRDVGRGVIGFVICAAVLMGAQVLSGTSVAEQLDALRAPSLGSRVLFCCIAVFGAALVEESLFRGYLQPALVARLGLPAAIVVQAVIFDLMHLNFHPLSLVVKLAFGLVFGVLRGKDGSLLAPAVAHGLIWVVFGA
jgi:membrane protease YdiL (CAAX protease family)